MQLFRRNSHRNLVKLQYRTLKENVKFTILVRVIDIKIDSVIFTIVSSVAKPVDKFSESNFNSYALIKRCDY